MTDLLTETAVIADDYQQAAHIWNIYSMYAPQAARKVESCGMREKQLEHGTYIAYIPIAARTHIMYMHASIYIAHAAMLC